MNNTIRLLSLGVIFVAVVAASYVGIPTVKTVETQDRPARSDVTIYLHGPLLDRGGTIFVLPREVPVDEWTPRPELPNPARSDPRLDERRPIAELDRRLSAHASQPISIVRFDYPAGGSFNFRFLPSLDSRIPPERLGSVLVTTGSTYDYHPENREEIFVPQFQVMTILGPDADEAKSRALVSGVKIGYLEERYSCDTFESVLSCDAGHGAR